MRKFILSLVFALIALPSFSQTEKDEVANLSKRFWY